MCVTTLKYLLSEAMGQQVNMVGELQRSQTPSQMAEGSPLELIKQVCKSMFFVYNSLT